MPDSSHKLVVTSLRPGNRKREICLWLILAAATFTVGLLLGFQLFDQAMVEKRQQASELALLQQQLVDLNQKLTNAEMAAKVDSVALEQVRQLVTSLQSELAVDEEELRLYRNLLQGGGSESGLLVGELMLKHFAGQDGIAYRIVVQQKEKKLKRINASIDIEVIGVRDGEEVTLGLDELDTELEKMPVKAKFKYFHVVEGKIDLPSGFEPQALLVSVWKDGVSSSRVERRFNWRVDEL